MNEMEMAEKEFGSVVWMDEKYILTEQAECTSRMLSEQQKADGMFEMSAPAIRESDGLDAIVTWMFTEKFKINGEPEDLDVYDYNDVMHVIVW